MKNEKTNARITTLNNSGKQKGITLIALIITIIIMLILVAVTVSVAIDGNLFGKAEGAVSKTNAKVGKLQQDVDYYTNKLNEVSEGTSGENNPAYKWENKDSGYSDDGEGLVMGVYIEEGKYFKPSKQYLVNLLALEVEKDNKLVSLNENNTQTAEIKKVAVVTQKSTEKLLSGYKINSAGDDAAGMDISERMRTQIRLLMGTATRLDYARQYADYVQYASRKILKDEIIMGEYYNATGTTSESIKLGSNKTVTATESEIFELARQDALVMAEQQAIFKEGTIKHYVLREGIDTGATLTYTDKEGTSKSINILKVPAIVEDGLKNITKANYNTGNRFLVEDVKMQMDGLTDRLSILQEYTVRMLQNTIIAERRIRGADMENEMVQYSNNNILLQAGSSNDDEETSATNRAGDDESGLSVSENTNKQIRGLTQAGANAQNGISVMDTAEGAMEVMTIAIDKQLEYVNEAAALYDRPNTIDRENSLKNINQKIEEMTKVIDYIANSTQFNTLKLLDGTFLNRNIQVGPYVENTVSITIADCTPDALGINESGCNTKEKLENTRTKLIEAKQKIATERANCGAIRNRLEHTIENLDNVVENTQAAESRIRNTDMTN